MKQLSLTPIGQTCTTDGQHSIVLDALYRPALEGLEGFSHILVLWWFSNFDSPDLRACLQCPKPYRQGPEQIGTFATRGPVRPNPIAVTTAGMLHLDPAKGRIQVDYLDAHDGSPVLDIKPYTPSADRVLAPTVPNWCSHWPGSLEDSETFDWAAEFTF